MREYAGHLSWQSILDFALSSCACSLWHSPPMHSDLSWLNRLFYFINIHYMTWSCMLPRKAKLHASPWGFPILHFLNLTEVKDDITHCSLLDLRWCFIWAQKSVVVFPKNFPLPDLWHVKPECRWLKSFWTKLVLWLQYPTVGFLVSSFESPDYYLT